MIGEVLGSYRVVKKLGEGGMGEVYVAEHTQLGNRAAVKVLRPEMSVVPEIVQRFFNEARATTLIGHPGIVQVFDFGNHATTKSAYFIMEMLAGESLGGRLRREPQMAPELIVPVMLQVCDALAAAHEAGIVHRDLKPDNLFLIPDRAAACGIRVKVLDFGIAKLADDVAGLKTSTNALMGTPAYMSPEQCRGAGLVDQRSDMYSLGCILFEMATGQRVFSYAEATGDLVVAHLHQQPPMPSAVAPVPPGLEAVILRMLAKRPEDRYQTMRELIAELERLAAGLMPLYGLSAAEAAMAANSGPMRAPPPGSTLPQRPQHTANSGVAMPHTTLGGSASESMVKPGKSRKSTLAAVIGAVSAVAIGVGVFAATRSGEKTNKEVAPAAAPVTTNAATVTPPATEQAPAPPPATEPAPAPAPATGPTAAPVEPAPQPQPVAEVKPEEPPAETSSSSRSRRERERERDRKKTTTTATTPPVTTTTTPPPPADTTKRPPPDDDAIKGSPDEDRIKKIGGE